MTAVHAHNILVVDDERNMRRVLQALLEGHGHHVDSAADGDEARALLRRASPGYDLVLTDLRMPNCDGMQLLRTVNRAFPDTPVVFITAHGTVDTAVEAMREGAFDFITKPFDDSELASVVGKALSHREANRDHAYSPGVGIDSLPPGSTLPPGAIQPLELEGAAAYDDDAAVAILSRIIGVSEPMKRLFQLLRRVAPSPTTILIRGESGTGKELVATAIHRLSERGAGPMISVNCTAIPESLFESELFGHVKGAFTGAVADRPGRFELADSGTLFLDEIGELPLPMQAKLLRSLQERQIQRVGGLHPIDVDVRLVAATNSDLDAMVKAGEFREDLFYRLHVVPIHLPPLRERPTDIPVLVRHFVARFRQRLGRDVHGVSQQAEMALVQFPWPGNIRQLENVIERMVLLAEGGELTMEDLPPDVRDFRGQEIVDTVRDDAPMPEGNLKDIVRVRAQQVERDLILRALEEDAWNVTHAARRLGISRKGLQLKMKDYELRPQDGTP